MHTSFFQSDVRHHSTDESYTIIRIALKQAEKYIDDLKRTVSNIQDLRSRNTIYKYLDNQLPQLILMQQTLDDAEENKNILSMKLALTKIDSLKNSIQSFIDIDLSELIDSDIKFFREQLLKIKTILTIKLPTNPVQVNPESIAQNAVYKEQQEYIINNQFIQLLKNIRQLTESWNKPSCFISYAYPHKDFPHEAWTEEFTECFHKHLQLAGIAAILDKQSSLPGGNPQIFMERIANVNHVILMCTQSLKQKSLQDPIAMVKAELNLIYKRLSKRVDGAPNGVIPILLSGTNDNAVPHFIPTNCNFMSFYDDKPTIKYHYLESLKKLLCLMYSGQPKYGPIEKLFVEFTQNLELQEQSISKGMTC